MIACRAMNAPLPVADLDTKTVSLNGTTYAIQTLSDDSFTVLDKGVPVGRIVYSFGSANGVVEGTAITEDNLTAIAEVWFAALDG